MSDVGTHEQVALRRERPRVGDRRNWLELAQPRADWLALDVTWNSLKTAQSAVSRVRGVITARMDPDSIAAGVGEVPGNLLPIAARGDGLPLPAGRFDLVTCRSVARRVPDVFRFILECARVLKPGGLLLLRDHALPDDPAAARYVSAFDRLLDPSSGRAYAAFEWEGCFLDAGFTISHSEVFVRRRRLLARTDHAGCTPYIVERLQILLAQAPSAAAAWMRPRRAGTPDAEFDSHQIIIMGRKGS